MTMAYKSGIPFPPKRMLKLPVDKRGYPVPKFVAHIKGDWDFRVVEPGWLAHCLRFKTCWLCGDPLGANMVFVVGPMCVVNRASGEPPCHLECARFAAQACPFMTNPSRPRNEGKMDEIIAAGGAMNVNGLARNPGCTALYVTGGYTWLARDRVIRMGEPDRIEWWCEGRTATRAEIEHSIETGLPLLRAAEEGPAAEAALQAMLEKARAFLPAR